MVTACFTMPLMNLRLADRWPSSFGCRFYFSKVFEFIDTFIMVLKKNNRQISFLHVYHHSTIFIIWWLAVLLQPTGSSYFSAAYNSLIHVVMYGYYFLSGIGVKSVSLIKRYITVMQMTQFTLMMIQSIVIMYHTFPQIVDLASWTIRHTRDQFKADPRVDISFWLAALLCVYMWSMLGLFGNFFIQEGKRQRALRGQAKHQAKTKKTK
ncbi:ELO family [Polychytrium aggregatum]|uniref:ELO family n=1 Tax=Polychytrium aggregatum TaxID=110093 RepID=UPI0022FEB92C|nr:ELO family [Polychytrium aggregatum]KAI9197042.1 ELO family [Polychytrium aggregatum]